jgi:hypothetical protein
LACVLNISALLEPETTAIKPNILRDQKRVKRELFSGPFIGGQSIVLVGLRNCERSSARMQRGDHNGPHYCSNFRDWMEIFLDFVDSNIVSISARISVSTDYILCYQLIINSRTIWQEIWQTESNRLVEAGPIGARESARRVPARRTWLPIHRRFGAMRIENPGANKDWPHVTVRIGRREHAGDRGDEPIAKELLLSRTSPRACAGGRTGGRTGRSPRPVGSFVSHRKNPAGKRFLPDWLPACHARGTRFGRRADA